MNEDRPTPAEPRPKLASTAEETAERIKAWASGAHALAFRPMDEVAVPRPDTPADLFHCIDPEHLGRELQARKITMIGVQPGDAGIVIATERSVPAKSQPSATTNGVPLRFLKAGRPTTSLPSAAVARNPHQGMIADVYTCGSSISPLTRNTTGTLGCLVRDRTGRLLGLSNNHVSGGCGFLEPRMPVIAPGLADAQPGGLDAFVIGHHVDFAPWKPGLPQILDVRQNLDLAMFEIKDAALVSSMQGDHYDTPTSVMTIADIKAERSVSVAKVGRRTGLTRGTIAACVTGDTSVAYDQIKFKSDVHYLDMVVVERGDGGAFALPGDSGSLVVADVRGEKKALGVVFAISSDENLTFVMPMEVVLDRLGITLEGNHNVTGPGGRRGP